MNNIAILLKNPHLIIVVVILLGLQLAAIWFPAHAAQIDETRKAIYAYALIVAAVFNPAPPQQAEGSKP